MQILPRSHLPHCPPLPRAQHLRSALAGAGISLQALSSSSLTNNSPSKTVPAVSVTHETIINLPPLGKLPIATSSGLFRAEHVSLIGNSGRNWNQSVTLSGLEDWPQKSWDLVIGVHLCEGSGSWYVNEKWEVLEEYKFKCGWGMLCLSLLG